MAAAKALLISQNAADPCCAGSIDSLAGRLVSVRRCRVHVGETTPLELVGSVTYLGQIPQPWMLSKDEVKSARAASTLGSSGRASLLRVSLAAGAGGIGTAGTGGGHRLFQAARTHWSGSVRRMANGAR